MRKPYYPTPQTDSGRRRRDRWITGSDPVLRDKYYAYLKHRAQAKYRREHYELDFEDWLELWPDSKWHLRGRYSHSLCLTLLKPEFGWVRENCVVVNRGSQCKRIGGRNVSEHI